MIQIIIMILLICLLIYVLYSGSLKNYTISPYDLHSPGLIKTVSELKGDYNETEFSNNYKNFTHLFWFKIRYPESGRLYKHTVIDNANSNENTLIVDFHKDNAILDISLFNTDTSSPHLKIERTNFPINKWVFVAIVMEGDTLDLYLQDKLYDTRQTAATMVNSNMSWGNVIFGKDALDDQGTDVNFSEDNASLSAYRFFPYQYSQANIISVFKDEYPIYYNRDNVYEMNLELSKNGTTSKFSI